MHANQDIIFEHLINIQNQSRQSFAYEDVMKIAREILRATQAGKEYATLKFLQKYCVSNDGGNKAAFFKGDPRKYGDLPGVRKNWVFFLKDRYKQNDTQNKMPLDGNKEGFVQNVKFENMSANIATSKMVKKAKPQRLRSEFVKDEYLSKTHVKGFLEYICNLEVGKAYNLHHEYTIDDKKWAKALKCDGRPPKLVINSLTDAFSEYFWPTQPNEDEEDVDANNSNFESNAIVLNGLSGLLRAALKENDSQAVFLQCIKILDWGQVYRGSIRWLVERYENNTLLDDIGRATKILEGNTTSALIDFENESIRIDSGLTKVFALASENSIIYDDRVGAALGLLVKKYLESLNSYIGVPEELDFMPGRKKERNSSTKTLKFTGRGNKPSFIHARSNLLANWVVGAVANNLGRPWDIRRVEAGLFMIGYRVS